MKIETNAFVPQTVGEMIELLKKYPAEWYLGLSYVDTGDDGSEWESIARRMRVDASEGTGSLEITIK